MLYVNPKHFEQDSSYPIDYEKSMWEYGQFYGILLKFDHILKSNHWNRSGKR
jgi:hypothetical protein